MCLRPRPKTRWPQQIFGPYQSLRMKQARWSSESLASRTDLPGLLAVRGLTKTWSPPGPRAGYLLSPPDLAARSAPAQPLWSVSTGPGRHRCPLRTRGPRRGPGKRTDGPPRGARGGAERVRDGCRPDDESIVSAGQSG
ncbi:hypothetical protein GCM10009603_34340 [Nocardiopsis exhalans]